VGGAKSAVAMQNGEEEPEIRKKPEKDKKEHSQMLTWGASKKALCRLSDNRGGRSVYNEKGTGKWKI